MLMDWAQTDRGAKSSLRIRLEEDWYIVGREESAFAVLTTSKYPSTLHERRRTGNNATGARRRVLYREASPQKQRRGLSRLGVTQLLQFAAVFRGLRCFAFGGDTCGPVSRAEKSASTPRGRHINDTQASANARRLYAHGHVKSGVRPGSPNRSNQLAHQHQQAKGANDAFFTFGQSSAATAFCRSSWYHSMASCASHTAHTDAGDVHRRQHRAQDNAAENATQWWG